MSGGEERGADYRGSGVILEDADVPGDDQERYHGSGESVYVMRWGLKVCIGGYES